MTNGFNNPDEHDDTQNGVRHDQQADAAAEIEAEANAEANAEAEEQLTLADEGERLPWLESDEDYDDDGVDIARLVIVGLLGLVAVLALLGLAWWLSKPSADNDLLAEGSTIEAPDDPYRTLPEDPGGSEVAGTGDMSFEVGEGQTRQSQLAADGDAPAPSIDRDQGAATAAQAAAASAASAASASEITSEASSGNVAVQVAAYSSRTRAEQGWTDLTNRFDALQGLSHQVEEATVDGAKVYRLQALTGSAANANSVCRALRAAGGDCQVKR